MNMGDIVGQLPRDGLSPATQDRLQQAVGQGGLGGLGDGLNDMLGGSSPVQPTVAGKACLDRLAVPFPSGTTISR